MLMLKAYKDRQKDNYKGKTKAYNAPLWISIATLWMNKHICHHTGFWNQSTAEAINICASLSFLIMRIFVRIKTGTSFSTWKSISLRWHDELCENGSDSGSGWDGEGFSIPISRTHKHKQSSKNLSSKGAVQTRQKSSPRSFPKSWAPLWRWSGGRGYLDVNTTTTFLKDLGTLLGAGLWGGQYLQPKVCTKHLCLLIRFGH